MTCCCVGVCGYGMGAWRESLRQLVLGRFAIATVRKVVLAAVR